MKSSVRFSSGSKVENYRQADIDSVFCVATTSKFFTWVFELGRNIRERQWNFNAQAFSFFQEYVCLCGNQQ